MAMSTTRKRGAFYVFEKPLVSRLPFEAEVDAGGLARKRVRIAATTTTETTRPPSPPAHEDLDVNTSENVETQHWWTREALQERHRGEEADSCSSSSAIAPVGADVGRGCWLGGRWGAREGSGRDTRGGTRPSMERVEPECPDKQAVSTAATGGAGPGRTLVQLKIDAMFAVPGLPCTPPSECSGRIANAELCDGECARTTCRGDGAMDVDVGVGAEPGEEGGPACYACRGALGTAGGDILCSFCDRAACQACWQRCSACGVPHCSLCLAADYNSQFECYFCPSCYQDKRLECC
ncbi:unnamed protein product [Ectocarpus sp. CCAP 1310/34]|nr:unnamed protein product [Ectocarpus sp. CCAP 1310/34]